MQSLVKSVSSAGFVKTFSVAALLLSATPVFADGTAIDGVNWVANYTAESAEVLDGGLARRGAYAGQLQLGADLDLNHFLGWEGATLHVRGTNRHGENLSDKGIGNSTSVQEIYGMQNTHLVQVTIEQQLFNGRLVLSGGREPANITFLGSSLCQYFQLNAACGNPTFVFKNSNFTWWATSSWAFHAKAWLTPQVYFSAGAYEVNPNRTKESDHGLDWSLDGATGVDVPFALGYQTTLKTDTHPRKYEIGGWYDSSSYSDPLLDENGKIAALTGNSYMQRNGRAGWFLRGEQMVWRRDATTDRGLTVFGAVMGNIAGRAVESDYQKVGFVLKGTFESRPKDTIGFVFTRQGYSGIEMENLHYARASAGGNGTPHSSQLMMELSYGYELTDNIRLQPNIQYIIHPDQLGEPTRTKNLPNAFLVGFRFDVNFDRAFGLNR